MKKLKLLKGKKIQKRRKSLNDTKKDIKELAKQFGLKFYPESFIFYLFRKENLLCMNIFQDAVNLDTIVLGNLLKHD